jgi:outer membrane protein assembly factor BamA
MLQLSFERSLPPLGSDFDYWNVEAKANFYKKFFSTHNLALKTGVASGWHLPFQQKYTAGGVGLRGYRNQQFRGDFRRPRRSSIRCSSSGSARSPCARSASGTRRTPPSS